MNLLRKVYSREMFNPRFIGFFTNPYYIIRRGLYKGIKQNAPFLSGKLLDFGCGKKPYKNLFNVDEYIGVDLKVSDLSDWSESVEVLSHWSEEVDVYYDGSTIPFEKNHFDSVFSSEVFEHVFNIDTILNEINRVCKPNAHILITVPFVWDEHMIPYDSARYTSFGIKYLLEKHGFEVVKQYKTTNFVETLFQMWNAYVHQCILKYKVIQLLLTPVLISPVMFIGIILSRILPKNDSFYHNNIVLAKKISEKV